MIPAGLALLLARFLVWPVYYYLAYFAVSVGNERRLVGLGAGGPVVVFTAVYVATQCSRCSAWSRSRSGWGGRR